MLVKVKDLEEGTIFTYIGKTYKKGAYNYMSHNDAKTKNIPYSGKEQTDARLCKSHAKLGGKFQTNIDSWFNEETEVEVEEQ